MDSYWYMYANNFGEKYYRYIKILQLIMKGISKVSVKGFFVILTKEKYHKNDRVTNVRFNGFTKKMIKIKKA